MPEPLIWTPLAVRVPPAPGPYLAFGRDPEAGAWKALAQWIYGGGWADLPAARAVQVTHWMPLPPDPPRAMENPGATGAATGPVRVPDGGDES